VGHLVQTPCQSRVTYSRLHRTLSRRVLNISREGDSTASLGSLLQCSVTLRVKKFFLVFSWKAMSTSWVARRITAPHPRALPHKLLRRPPPRRSQSSRSLAGPSLQLVGGWPWGLLCLPTLLPHRRCSFTTSGGVPRRKPLLQCPSPSVASPKWGRKISNFKLNNSENLEGTMLHLFYL